jgi:hypothetical protein
MLWTKSHVFFPHGNLFFYAASVFATQGSACLLTGDFEECRTMANELQMRGFNALVGYASDLPLQERAVAAVAFLHQLANSSDGMCQLICRVLDEDFLARMLSFHPLLPKELSRAIYDLLLVLMAEQSFKIVIAVAYTQAYPKIARLYGKGLGQSASSAYALSVQFLNREVFVNDVCFAHNFLKVNVTAMNAMLAHAQQMSVNEQVACQGNQLSAAMTKALRHNIVIKRRYNSMIGDLKVGGFIVNSAAVALVAAFVFCSHDSHGQFLPDTFAYFTLFTHFVFR